MDERRRASEEQGNRKNQIERPARTRAGRVGEDAGRRGTSGERDGAQARRTAGKRTADTAPRQEGRADRSRSSGERTAESRRAAGEKVVRNRKATGNQSVASERASGERGAGARRVPNERTARKTAGERSTGTSRAAGAGRSTSGELKTRSARTPETERDLRSSRSSADDRARRASSYGNPPARKPKKKNGILKVILTTIILVIAIAGLLSGAFYWTKYGPSKEKYDLNTYFEIASDKQLGVTVDNTVIGAQGIMEEDRAYVSYEAVRDYLNDRFYWDPNENLLLYTLPTEMIRVNVGSKDYTISKETKSEDYVILKTDGSTAYIALDFVQQYTDFEYTVHDKEGTPRLMIVTKWGDVTTAVVKRDTQVRYRGGVKSPILAELEKGDKVTVIEDVSDWKEVRTEDGLIGYVKKTALRKEKTETIQSTRGFTEPEFTSIHKDYKINLAWHQVTSQAANSTVLETIAKTKGLTTISPTWFSVADNAGNISSIASSEYVNYAHQSGIEVWALVDNFNSEIDQMELLSHTTARENLVNQLISAALQSGIDGINVDFEQIPESVGEHYIQFIRELSVKCRLNNLVLSVDNYVPKGYNAHYHRKEQGIVADYVIIMGYDEHFGGSLEAGSVASYNYVKEGIEESLKDVPAEKLINGVPFYTRLWKEVPKTEEELADQQGTEEGNYLTKVTSEALGMEAAAKRVSDAGATAEWDDVTKQNYAEWSDVNGAVYEIWLEDSSSLEAKLGLMKDYQLAGTAAWKLGFETPDIWELIIKYVN